jgi:hypothetical protein
MAEHHSFAGMQFWFDDIRVTRGTMRNGLRRFLHTRRATNHA